MNFQVSYVRTLWSTYVNYVWLLHKNGSNHCTIVDPGEAEPCIQALSSRQLIPKDILITHHDGDHVNGVEAIVNQYGPMPIYGPKDSPYTGINTPLCDGETFVLPSIDETFTVMATPGHTLDHMAYYSAGMVLSGDALFTGGCGRLFEGTMAQLHDSVHKIGALPPETLLYCSHEYTVENLEFASKLEPDNRAIIERLNHAKQNALDHKPSVPSTIELEHQTNPFLRAHIPAVKQNCEAYAKRALQTELAVFEIIREWRG